VKVVVVVAAVGWGLLPMIAAGYAAWGIGLGALLLARQVTGV